MQNDMEKIILQAIIEKASINIDSGNEKDIDNFDLVNDLGFNSISLISLVVELEGQFNVEFEDEMLLMERLSTPQKIIEAVKILLEGID